MLYFAFPRDRFAPVGIVKSEFHISAPDLLSDFAFASLGPTDSASLFS